jgi:2-polyprenyl-3-methyl-5-hydroxy-6-metoxy-1,4-benzoquinol methylase
MHRSETRIENTVYKYDDYAIRSGDPYALAKYDIIMSWLPKRPGLRVLNAGCGSGELNTLLARHESWQIDAIDIDSKAVHLSQHTKETQKLVNVTISQVGIEDHPGCNYDVIISNDVLEHIHDDKLAIQKLADMLKPDGLLYVSVPALQWLFGYHDEMLGHYRRYNKRTLTERLSSHFDISRYRYFGGTLLPIAILYSLMLRRPYPILSLHRISKVSIALNVMLKLEEKITLPFGSSLLAMASLSVGSGRRTSWTE